MTHLIASGSSDQAEQQLPNLPQHNQNQLLAPTHTRTKWQGLWPVGTSAHPKHQLALHPCIPKLGCFRRQSSYFRDVLTDNFGNRSPPAFALVSWRDDDELRLVATHVSLRIVC